MAIGIGSILGNLDQSKRVLLENFLSLTILQGVNYVLPLITIPYLVRVLGPEKFGLIAFAQSFIQYFNILTDYGFNLSATREISIYRGDKEKVSEIFSSVMVIKFVLLILSFLLMTFIIFSFKKFSKDWLIYYLTFGMVVGQALFPIWFFQGMEKMKYITILNVMAKTFFTFSVFVFVHQTSDYLYVPLIYSLGFLLSGVLSIWIVFRSFKIRIYKPSLSILAKYLKDSSQFFLSRVSVSIYTISNTFFIGLFLGNKFAGFYSAAEKIFIALTLLYQPLVDALYPLMSRKKDVSFFKKIFFIVICVNTVLCIILFIVSPSLIELLYGKGFSVSANLLRIFSILGILIIPAVLLGYPFVAALGYPKYANYSVVIASIVHIFSLVLLSPIINVYLVAFLLIITQVIVLGVRVYGVKKNNLWSR